MTRLSCQRFRSNEVRLWLSVIAYDLGNLWRRLVLPKRVDNWSLTSLHQRLVKTSGRLVKHVRYYWLLLAESHLTRRLFANMVRRIAPKAKVRLKQRVRELTWRTRGVSREEMVRELLSYLPGWRSYFGFCQTSWVLVHLDSWIQRWLRSVL
jgi:hypothetical protein